MISLNRENMLTKFDFVSRCHAGRWRFTSPFTHPLASHGWLAIQKDEPFCEWNLHKDEPILAEVARKGAVKWPLHGLRGGCAAEVGEVEKVERVEGEGGKWFSGRCTGLRPRAAHRGGFGRAEWQAARGKGSRGAFEFNKKVVYDKHGEFTFMNQF